MTKHGCKNIEDIRSKLKTGEIRLDRNQKIGVDCYEDFQEKMHRDEVEKIGEIVYGAARDYLSSQETEKDKLRISIMGSYRRGKQTCGDVDVLITHTDFDDEVPATFLGGVVEKLMKAGHITHHLTYICGMDKGGYNREWGMPPKEKGLKTSCSSWMGVFGSPLYPGKRRRVDIKFYPHRERVFAELYFTGSGHFNRSMRLYADRKKGLKLTDKGLFYRDKYSTRVTDLDPKNEKEVFEYLGLKWTPPHERDCFDAVVADNGEYVDMSEESSSFRDYEDEDEKWIE